MPASHRGFRTTESDTITSLRRDFLLQVDARRLLHPLFRLKQGWMDPSQPGQDRTGQGHELAATTTEGDKA